MNGQNTNALVGPLDSDVAIKSRIFTIRGVQVMLDRDLAELYDVSTKALNQAVKRNIRRFPDDFMFQLGKEDVENLRSQFVTSSWGGLRYMPYAFTEHGVIMLASVLKSETAIAKFNKQNPTLELRHTGRFHDRFLVIDGKELYHFGASLKDLGRHYCAVSRMDAAFIPSIMQTM